MPTKIEKDAITGTETTGHEWDGIKELNTPLPKWWLYTFYATIVFAIIYMILYPAIPLGGGDYTKGVLGFSQRAVLETEMSELRNERAVYMDRFVAASMEEIIEDTELLNYALAGGRVSFADNCVPCHGAGGAGGPGFPSLADDGWLWGGTLADIYLTLQNGVRWTDNEGTRDSQMPAFAVDEILDDGQINDVTEYVLSLSNSAGDASAAERGAPIFAENCAACHGETGEGMRELGAPKLNDAIWLFGGDKETIIETIAKSRGGVMPAWGGRLDDATLKQLTIYVHSLGGGE